MPVTLRPIAAEDREFLYKVYASTREDELANVGWSSTEKEAFLRMQFDTQHRYYRQQFPQAAYDVILLDGKAIGRLYVDRSTQETHIIDIALLPEHRKAGIGSRLLKGIQDESAQAGKPILIYVEKNNPALGLYLKLGFVPKEDTGVYLAMRWSPETKNAA